MESCLSASELSIRDPLVPRFIRKTSRNMSRRLVFLLLHVFSLTYTLPVNTWRPVLEQKLDGCPCQIKLVGMATLMSRMTSEIVPREAYNKWVIAGRPHRVTKLPSVLSWATFGNKSKPLEFKPFCFVADKHDAGDYNIVMYSAGDDLKNLAVIDVTRGMCPNKSINDYGDNEVRDECKTSKDSRLENGSTKLLTPASRITQGGLVHEKETAAYNVKITHLNDDKHLDTQRCTGSLIAPQYVLTAAHCKVQLGEHVYIGEYLHMPGEKQLVSRAIVHEGYKELKSRHETRLATRLHDIQLLYLEAPVKNAEQRMVTLNADCNRPVPCRHGLVTGYGESMERHCKLDVLSSAVVDIVSHDECHKLLKDVHEDLEGHCFDESPHICVTHDLCGSGLCGGESSGPLVVALKGTKELLQVGISSFTVGDCGAVNRPDVYTRVSAYKE